jgi:hypothetical protein
MSLYKLTENLDSDKILTLIFYRLCKTFPDEQLHMERIGKNFLTRFVTFILCTG